MVRLLYLPNGDEGTPLENEYEPAEIENERDHKMSGTHLCQFVCLFKTASL